VRGDQRHPRSLWVEECLGLSDRREALHLPADIGARSRVRYGVTGFCLRNSPDLLPEEIHEYLDHLKLAKFLAPQEWDREIDDLDENFDEEPWLENPVMGAEELLRFCRVQQLFHS
jgi:hypothetical protein